MQRSREEDCDLRFHPKGIGLPRASSAKELPPPQTSYKANLTFCRTVGTSLMSFLVFSPLPNENWECQRHLGAFLGRGEEVKHTTFIVAVSNRI